MFTRRILFSAGLSLLFAPAVRAGVIYDVTLNTSVLSANNPGQGSFALDFELNDGSGGDGVNNNMAVIENLNLGGGSLVSATDSSSGSVSGSLSGSLTIADNGFFNDFNQQFGPGGALSFTLDLTTNVSPSERTTPDQFSFAVLSNDFGSTASLLTIDITGPTPSATPSGGILGNGDLVPAPNVGVVPEPTSLSLFALGLGMFAAFRRMRCVTPSAAVSARLRQSACGSALMGFPSRLC